MEGSPYCPLLAMTGSNTPLGCSLPSLQLSNAACNVAGCSKPLPSGTLPKGNGSKQTSTHWNTDICRILWTGSFHYSYSEGRQELRHDYLHTGHQESSSTTRSLRRSLIYSHWEHHFHINSTTRLSKMYMLPSQQGSCLLTSSPKEKEQDFLHENSVWQNIRESNLIN